MATRRRRIGLRARVISSFMALSALLAFGLSGATYFLMRTSTLERRESTAQDQAYDNARILREQLLNEPALIERRGDLLTREPVDGLALLRIGDDGGYLQSSDSVGETPFNPKLNLPAELQLQVREGNGAVLRTHIKDEPVLYVGVPIRLSATPDASDDVGGSAPADPPATTAPGAAGATDGGSVAVPEWAEYYEVSSLQDIEDTFETLFIALLIADGMTIVIGALVGRWVSRRVLAPLSDVNDAVHALAEMEFDTKLPVTRDPDLAPLVSTFNHTVAALHERIERDGRFASDVSHELRSPLTTLTNSVAILERYQDDLPEPAQQAVSLLTEEFQRFQQLVSDLLEISRFDAGAQRLDRSPLVIGEFVRHAVRAIVAEDIPVEIDPDLEEAVIMADKRRLMQVLSNLAVNAQRYAGGATAVDVQRARGGVEIAVSDSGPGVPLEDRIKVFERFARGVNANKRGSDGGTGLGLALVAEHLRLHGGTVRVEDRLDGEPGARFVVYLPANPVSIYDTEADFEAAGIGADL